MFRGLAPADVMVIVLVLTGGPEGAVGWLSPQAARTPNMPIALRRRANRTATMRFIVQKACRAAGAPPRKQKSPEGSEVREAAYE